MVLVTRGIVAESLLLHLGFDAYVIQVILVFQVNPVTHEETSFYKILVVIVIANFSIAPFQERHHSLRRASDLRQ